MNEARIHQVFQASILLKGFHAIIECVSGLLLAVISADTIIGFVNRLTQDQLVEDKHDHIAGLLRHFTENYSVSDQNFYAFYLLSHGLVKVALVIGLLRGKMWAYPASLVVLGGFILYQLYRYSYTHGIGLIVLTVFDVVVMWLVWHEYRVVREKVAP